MVLFLASLDFAKFVGEKHCEKDTVSPFFSFFTCPQRCQNFSQQQQKSVPRFIKRTQGDPSPFLAGGDALTEKVKKLRCTELFIMQVHFLYQVKTLPLFMQAVRCVLPVFFHLFFARNHRDTYYEVHCRFISIANIVRVVFSHFWPYFLLKVCISCFTVAFYYRYN